MSKFFEREKTLIPRVHLRQCNKNYSSMANTMSRLQLVPGSNALEV